MMNHTEITQHSSPVLDHALQYAAAGLPVLRLKPRGKAPLEQHGFKDATVDPGEIEQRWKERPNAGVGIRTGEPLPAGGCSYVIDVDADKDGGTALQGLMDDLGPLPETLTIATSNGGEHRYFVTDTPLPCRTGIADGIDGRGAGGYVVAPPSVHPSGHVYRVSCDAPMAALPPAWVELIVGPRDGRDGRDGRFAIPDAIVQSERNDTLFRYACSERAKGATDTQLRELVNDANSTRCHPALEHVEVDAIVASALRYPPGAEPAASSPGEAQTSESGAADKVAALARAHTLFHDPDGAPYALVPVGAVVHVLGVDSREYRSIIERAHYERHRKVASDSALKAGIGVIAARARYDGESQEVHLRIAGDLTSVKLDLTDEQHRAAQITSTGVEIVRAADPPPFRRAPGPRPLPVPDPSGRIEDLRELINVADDGMLVRVAGFLLGSMHPFGPYLIASIYGPQGSGKSSATETMRRMVDPVDVMLRPLPTGGQAERNLFVSARSNWMLAWDNVSAMNDSMSDALCRMATGGGFAARANYTDGDEYAIKAIRPQILNGITEIATRPDLLDRMLLIRLPAITPQQRRTKADLDARIADLHPRILGALCNATSTAIANLPSTRLEAPSRMADIETWITAGESSFGWAPGTFSTELRRSRRELVESAIESSPFAQLLLRTISPGGEWNGTASELRSCWLDSGLGGTVPGSPRGVAGILERMEPALIEAGFTIHRLPRQNDRRPLRITRRAEATVTTVTPSPQTAVERHFGPVTLTQEPAR